MARASFGRRVQAACFVLACCLFGSSDARAQATPPWLRVRHQVLAELEDTRSYSIDVRKRERQNRARSITAAGSALVLSSLLTIAYVMALREPCHGSEQLPGKRALGLAGALGSLGAIAVIGGATWQRVQVRRDGVHASKQRRGAMAAGVLTFVLSQAALGGLTFADMICHS